MGDVDLAQLRARSAELGTDGSSESLEVNRAILELVPGDPIAANRLGIGLLNNGDLLEAKKVFEAAAEANPHDQIPVRRLAEIRHKLSTPPPKPKPPKARGPKKGAAHPVGPTYWIKAVHYADDGWTIAPGEETWISDPGRRDKDGKRVYRADGVPWGEPSWRVGDELGLYFGGTMRVPVLVEVIAPAEFNPELVQSKAWGGEDDGERWPWVTPVRGLYAKPLAEAPTLDELQIDSKLVQRRPRFTISADQRQLIVGALGDGVA